MRFYALKDFKPTRISPSGTDGCASELVLMDGCHVLFNVGGNFSGASASMVGFYKQDVEEPAKFSGSINQFSLFYKIES